ncbi:MAG: hypothetical protein ACE5J4_02235 [Candidatus Aenigmatarchaeota archaeon]
MVRALHKIKIGDKEFFIDGRLCQLRYVKDPNLFVDCITRSEFEMTCRIDININRKTGKIEEIIPINERYICE